MNELDQIKPSGFLQGNKKLLIASLALVAVVAISAVYPVSKDSSRATVISSVPAPTIDIFSISTSTDVGFKTIKVYVGGILQDFIPAGASDTTCQKAGNVLMQRKDGTGVCCPRNGYTGVIYLNQTDNLCYTTVAGSQSVPNTKGILEIPKTSNIALNIEWKTTNASVCKATGGVGTWSSFGTSDIGTTGAISSTFSGTSNQTYTLTCQNSAGTVATKNFVVNYGPVTTVVTPPTSTDVPPPPGSTSMGIVTPTVTATPTPVKTVAPGGTGISTVGPATIAVNATPTDPFATSSSYLLVPSITKGLTLVSGSFGLNIIADSCKSYANIATDLSATQNIFKQQTAKVIVNFFNKTKCQTPNPGTSVVCKSYVNTIDNLLISYGEYKLQELKSNKDKALTCDASGNSNGGYRKDWFGVDLNQVVYASVRDALINTKTVGTVDLFNAIDKNLTTNFNSAYTASKFTDSGSKSALNTFATKYLNLTTTASNSPTNQVEARTIYPSTVSPTFFVFGLTDNSKTVIGSIGFNSASEYTQAFNSGDITKFSDLYNKSNASYIKADSALMTKLDGIINARLDKIQSAQMGGVVATAVDTTNTLDTAKTQKASVIDSIGSWFNVIWSPVSDFFHNLFGAKDAGAATADTASGTGGVCNGTDISNPPKPYLLGDKTPSYNKEEQNQFATALWIFNVDFFTVSFYNYFSMLERSDMDVVWTITPKHKKVLTPNQEYFLNQWDKYLPAYEQINSFSSYTLDQPTIGRFINYNESPFNCLLEFGSPRFEKLFRFDLINIKAVAGPRRQTASMDVFYSVGKLETLMSVVGASFDSLDAQNAKLHWYQSKIEYYN